MSEDFSFLPELLAEIAEVAGSVAAVQVARAKGGQRAYIPKVPHDGHWLVDAVGMDTAKCICQHFTTGVDTQGGVEVHVPFGPDTSTARRKRAIAEMIGQGKSANEIAARVHVDRRTVFRHKKAQGNKDNGQGSLF